MTTDPAAGCDVVTGAFSYSGSRIALALAGAGREVRTLTGHPERAAGSAIAAYPLDFADRAGLVKAMSGATTLYNTYWVRFAHGSTDHDLAVANSRILFSAARDAGIERIVHVSILHADVESALPYFRGKALVEEELIGSGISYAILRPAIFFGGDDVLVNNIAWLLRHLPVFGIGGGGDYRIRGIHVDDLARLCVEYGAARTATRIDAVGPDRPTFRELVEAVRTAVGSRSRLVPVPGAAVPVLARVLGLALRDVLLTRDEYQAMALGFADSDAPTTGDTSILSWLSDNGERLGRTYANELHRHFATT
jgi:uncharacterized protein YbjT (DUF2867 family)